MRVSPCPGRGARWQGSLVDLCKMEVDALELMRAAPVSPEGLLFDRHVRNLLVLGLVRREGELLGITQRGRRAAASLAAGRGAVEQAARRVPSGLSSDRRTARRIA